MLSPADASTDDIRSTIELIESVTKYLSGIASLVETHVGRQPPLPRDGWRIIWALRQLFRAKYGAIKIKSEEIEVLKKKSIITTLPTLPNPPPQSF